MKKNSPMAQTMCLTLFGPIFIGLAQFIMYLLIRTYRCNKILVSIRKNKGKRKKYSHRAQTMQDMSFGPVFMVLAQPYLHFIIRSYIYNNTLISIQDIKEKLKNTHLWPKGCVWRCLGPFSLPQPILLCI